MKLSTVSNNDVLAPSPSVQDEGLGALDTLSDQEKLSILAYIKQLSSFVKEND